jgi:hypothetical protein
VVYNLLRGKSASTYNSIISAMDKVNQVLVAFSDKFGDYPFKNEKHGFYEGLGGAGGMEHQTFSANGLVIKQLLPPGPIFGWQRVLPVMARHLQGSWCLQQVWILLLKCFQPNLRQGHLQQTVHELQAMQTQHRFGVMLM